MIALSFKIGIFYSSFLKLSIIYRGQTLKCLKKYGAPSVKKAFAILNAISSSREGLGVSELAKKLKMAKSTVHGMTSALEELGAVMRNPLTKKYKLGFTLLEIGRSAYSQIDLKTAARPVTEDLMEKNRTSVFWVS